MKISVITLLVLLIMFKVQAQLNPQDLQRTGSERSSSKGINNQGNSIPVLNTKILNSFSENMVEVEGGTFIMGCKDDQGKDCNENEKPAHKVSVTSFKISKYEVTRAQWRAVMGNYSPMFKGCDQCAMENVSWNKLKLFIDKLNTQTGRRFRLPTEAEWEYAARGGNKSQGFQYSGSNDLDKVAWYNGNSNKTKPVGKKQPNELGLYDMTGNLEEWCADWYGEKYYENSPDKDPQGPAAGQTKVIRGGSWIQWYDKNRLKVSFRTMEKPENMPYDTGFRLVEY